MIEESEPDLLDRQSEVSMREMPSRGHAQSTLDVLNPTVRCADESMLDVLIPIVRGTDELTLDVLIHTVRCAGAQNAEPLIQGLRARYGLSRIPKHRW